ncbi:adenosine deaminase AGSA-like [Physella acuta]|uniref:adenosine deaminase AGSA-like n=1 Tax=Physella acuta TaxID=109671 RepID=UPI0027DDAE3A|nr:adenosine deaminase AGSA-like [Physella acuta]
MLGPIILILPFVLVGSLPVDTSDYLRVRQELIDRDEHMRVGANLVLSDKEKIVNDYFMKEKRSLIHGSRINRTSFMPSTSFYHSRKLIEETPLFKKIHQMPKGAALHLHDQSMVSLDWIVYNATYRDNVWMCLNHNGFLIFRVFNDSYQPKDCKWKSVAVERKAAPNVTAFDLNIRNNLSMIASDPFLAFPYDQAAWLKFNRYFIQVGRLLYYVPIYRDMLWQTMEEFRAANVQYMEIRGTFFNMYELNGIMHDAEFGVLLVKHVVGEFVKKYPDFVGVKVIQEGYRNKNVSDILEEIKIIMELHKSYPEVVAGYDMSGDEAVYNPLSYYSEALLYPSRQDPPYKLPYFFHAGETPWQGTETGYNIADAILLNASRIGHGFALAKHPYFLELVKQKDIAVEVLPISNQVLRLVSDFRNHPMAALMANNLSVVISSDDRTTWDAAPLSHDFYITFMSMSSEAADLTLLKQLAINSIKYSSLVSEKKNAALEVWQAKWDNFVGVTHATLTPTTTSVYSGSHKLSDNLSYVFLIHTCLISILYLRH